MSDRKPIGDLFDFPTGQAEERSRPSTEPDPEQASQQDLFAESGARSAEPTEPSDLWYEDERDAGVAANESADPAADGFAAARHDPARVPAPSPLEEQDTLYDSVGGFDSEPPPPVADAPGADPTKPTVAARGLGGIADLLLHLAVLALGLAAMLRLGLAPSVELWPGFAGFLLCFSFLYVTLPLAFWGQTPGMAWCGLRAHDRDGFSLTFVQAMLRWAGSLVTFALLGLPLIVAFSGRSLADILSGSDTSRL